MSKTTTLSAAVDTFVTARESELIDADLPAIVQLRLLAAQLDADPTASGLHSQFGLSYRGLVKALDARADPDSVDPLEAELAALEA
jgi:hypothetical protein